MMVWTLWPKAASPWVVSISVLSLHTRFRAFPPQRLAQHLLAPSPMHHICATVASTFILRRCAHVTVFCLTSTATVWKSVPHGCGRDNPKYISPALEFTPRCYRRIPFWTQMYCLGFQDICQYNRRIATFSTCEGAKSCPDFCGGVYYTFSWDGAIIHFHYYIVQYTLAVCLRHYAYFFTTATTSLLWWDIAQSQDIPWTTTSYCLISEVPIYFMTPQRMRALARPNWVVSVLLHDMPPTLSLPWSTVCRYTTSKVIYVKLLRHRCHYYHMPHHAAACTARSQREDLAPHAGISTHSADQRSDTQ
jgi:hypothetical protein